MIADADVTASEGVYDVNWRSSLNETRATRPSSLTSLTNGGFTPVAGFESRTDEFQEGLSGRTPLGTTYSIGMNVQRLDETTFNPTTLQPVGTNLQWSTFVGIQLTQPLAKGFGIDVNNAQITINRKNKDISYQQFIQQVMQIVANVESSYYNLIYYLENVKVKQKSLELAQRFLDESKKRLEVGTLARLDIVQAEAEVAQREAELIDAKRLFELSQNNFKSLVYRDVVPSRATLVMPADRPTITPIPIDALESIRLGLENRPEYLQRKTEIERTHVFVKYYRNGLLPQIDLNGSYGYNAVSSGDRTRDFSRMDDNVDSINQGAYPTWSAGLTVTIPLGNNTARGNYKHWKLAAEQALLNLKKTEQDIIVGVDNAVVQAQAKAKLIVASQAATRLQEESLRAEEEKLKAGTSTAFVVLRVQRDLTDARVKELGAIADYNQALVDLRLKDATILKRAGVGVEPDTR